MEPVIAGLDKENRPFICSTDLIGCINFAKDFVVSGTTSNQLFGMCESLWEPDLVCGTLFLVIDNSNVLHDSAPDDGIGCRILTESLPIVCLAT